ncbi:hypothetical protein GGX14DRAFT_626514 [Mycena pura]|uniref:Uncharacterized protein n=1 Tax=Mycena pura TaxID=153505 RepID=A0AAD6YHF0_9AGAR|nr:hypothetical protein GGX14DRAFT_626514 [Mycena pura]
MDIDRLQMACNCQIARTVEGKELRVLIRDEQEAFGGLANLAHLGFKNSALVWDHGLLVATGSIEATRHFFAVESACHWQMLGRSAAAAKKISPVQVRFRFEKIQRCVNAEHEPPVRFGQFLNLQLEPAFGSVQRRFEPIFEPESFITRNEIQFLLEWAGAIGSGGLLVGWATMAATAG